MGGPRLVTKTVLEKIECNFKDFDSLLKEIDRVKKLYKNVKIQRINLYCRTFDSHYIEVTFYVKGETK